MPKHVQGRKIHLASVLLCDICLIVGTQAAQSAALPLHTEGVPEACRSNVTTLVQRAEVWKDLCGYSAEKEVQCCWTAHPKFSLKPKTTLWGQELLLLWAQVVARSRSFALPAWQYSAPCDCDHCILLPFVLAVKADHSASLYSGIYMLESHVCPLFPSLHLSLSLACAHTEQPSSPPLRLSWAVAAGSGSTSAPPATPAPRTTVPCDAQQGRMQFKGWELKRRVKNTWQSNGNNVGNAV